MLDGTILAALADSESGRNAAEQAIRLAAATNSKLAAISVIPPVDGDINMLHVANAREAMEAPHRAALDAVRAMAAERGVTFTPILAEGQAHEQIVDRADAVEANLIVLADSRRGAMERAFLGPTAARVVGYTQRDVLVVPHGTTLDFSKILLAVDGSATSRNAAAKAMELAEAYGGSLQVLSAARVLPEYNLWGTVVDDMLAKARRIAQDFADQGASRGLRTEVRAAGGDPAEIIVETARETGAGCIVIGSHGRTGLRRLLMGSVAQAVLAGAPCPVLIVH